MEPQENKQNNSEIEIEKDAIFPVQGTYVNPAQQEKEKTIFHPSGDNTVIQPHRISPDDIKNSVKKDGYIKIEPKQKSEYRPEEKIKISPLHTYADDVKNAVEGGKISMVKMMMAEAKKQELEKENEEEVSAKSPKNIKIISLSIGVILLACLGFVVAWYFITQKNTDSVSEKITRRQSVIPHDEEFDIPIDVYTKKKIIEGLASAKIKSYESDTAIVYLAITDVNSSSTDTISTERFLSVLETRVPDALRRSFGDKFMLGLNKNGGQIEPFVILTSDSFNQMYAGMLEWEPRMADDIGPLFFTKEDLIEVPETVGTTTPQTFATQNLGGQAASSTAISTSTNLTSSSTSSSTSPEEFKPKYILASSLKFKDELLRNRDVRALRTASSRVLMYYTFINENIVLIAKDFITLEEVVKRLATTQFKQ